MDPAKFQLVFERFASESRGEPPDIDIDFEHERREEIIQYVYEKYGRDRAGMTASVITYRGRSAVRDVGKALGFSQDSLDQLASRLDWWHQGTLSETHLAEIGVDPKDGQILRLLKLTEELLGFPRHLSQHVGGLTISQSSLDELVPIENASMKDRTVIEWDKDDIDIVGMFKADCLGLGMLTALRKCFALMGVTDYHAKLRGLSLDDPLVYEMISDADTIGVFQVESRAQMSMLPRLRPEVFFDLIVEVAIVRPGPIQGDMVHPYLLRREARRADENYKIEYEKPELKVVLERTLGVPIFQEQAMQMAMVAAKFTGKEADELRRAMATWKRSDGLGRFGEKFVGGMVRNGYSQEFSERCFKQISGFGEYGFPESHAVSFAFLVYASAWIKRYYPAVFLAGMLNSLPMGFYGPAQLVRDGREHGVEVREVDVNFSEWDCVLEEGAAGCVGRGKATWGHGGPAVRLGFRMVKGMRDVDAHAIAAARRAGGNFVSLEDLQRRVGLDVSVIRRLARADAFGSMVLSRRQAGWEALALTDEKMPLMEAKGRMPVEEPGLFDQLPVMPAYQEVMTDYSTQGLSLKRHPVAFARRCLEREGVVPAAWLLDPTKTPTDRWVSVAGLVLVRQRPGTAKNVTFITLEDETGVANLVVWSRIYELFRKDARHATLLQVDGVVQREGKVVHVVAQRLISRDNLLPGIEQRSRDFH